MKNAKRPKLKKRTAVNQPRNASNKKRKSLVADRASENDTLVLSLKAAKSICGTMRKAQTVQISSIPLQKRVKEFVQSYFRELRPQLMADVVATDELDKLMQDLLPMANNRTSAKVYIKIFNSILIKLGEAEVSREILKSQSIVKEESIIAVIAQQDELILNTLQRFNESAALSYRQALADLQVARSSYRGTAAELREVLREVLDTLSPDNEVQAVSGFKLEQGRTHPTMKQKVHYILKNREITSTLMDAPKLAAEIVDESVPRLVRATYDRGSVSTHTHSNGRAEIMQIKMYLDSVLCDLLEIHKTPAN